MPYPHIRSGERLQDVGPRTVGVCVFTPDGKRYFFPGGSPELASQLMKMSVADDVLKHPQTRIEFGYVADRYAWVCERMMKVVVAAE